MSEFDREVFPAARIRELLAQLGTALSDRGVAAELFIVGGSAMALAYNRARTTADIDAIFDRRDIVLAAAKDIAERENLSDHWLSDAVRQLMPAVPDSEPRELGSFGSLRVSICSPEYLLAMKAMVNRKSLSDLDDAARLCLYLGITSENEVETVVRRFFGDGALGAQELWIEDIIERAATLR